MTDIQSAQSTLARLVLFMVCLAIAGSAIVGAYYVAVNLPAQKGLTAPDNGVKAGQNRCEIYKAYCENKPDFYTCLASCIIC